MNTSHTITAIILGHTGNVVAPSGKSSLHKCLHPLEIVHYMWTLLILSPIRKRIITCKYPILSKKMIVGSSDSERQLS